MKKSGRYFLAALCIAALVLVLSGCAFKEARLIGTWKVEYITDSETGEKTYADDVDLSVSFYKDGTGHFESSIGLLPSRDFQWSVEDDKIIYRIYDSAIDEDDLYTFDSHVDESSLSVLESKILKLSSKELLIDLRDFSEVDFDDSRQYGLKKQ